MVEKSSKILDAVMGRESSAEPQIITGDTVQAGPELETGSITAPEQQKIVKEQVDSETVRKLMQILQKYKSGKATTQRRVMASENWWHLRNNIEEQHDGAIRPRDEFRSRSAWLHNVVVSKHADAMDNYPEPNIRPMEAGDRMEARMLTSVIPCILDMNHFKDVYSDAHWQKFKTGTGIYKVTWDKTKLHGIGDINISRVNILNLYWQPGINDIQDSRYVFEVQEIDWDILREQFPDKLDKNKTGKSFTPDHFQYDDAVDTSDQAAVIECYYHKMVNGRNTLQYVRFVEDVVLYATENIPELAERGLYDHARFPYVFDVLYPVEGSPVGYGFIDLCKNPQTQIDMLNNSFVKNAMVGSSPRYFKRQDGGINEAEFLDTAKPFVSVNGNLGEDAVRQITFSPLPSIYVSVLDRIVNELRETAGNNDVSNGSTPSGVTSGAAIAALQQAAGRSSADSTRTSWRAFEKVTDLCIELVRQFYDIPRQFRITGQMGEDQFVSYSNAGIRPQQQGNDFGIDMGYRLPEFDIKVSAQKASEYTKIAQNELALQFFQLGFFNPQITDQALMAIQMMDFDGKEDVIQQVVKNGTMQQKLMQYMKLALTMAQESHPEMVEGLSQDIMATMGGEAPMPRGSAAPIDLEGGEEKTGAPTVDKARKQSAESTRPDSGSGNIVAG